MSTTKKVRAKKIKPEDQELLKQKIRLLEHKLELKKKLPHLHGYKLYQWQRDYLDAPLKGPGVGRNLAFICAANQIGKSVVNFIKMVTWATTPELWPKLWKQTPSQFWYITVDRNFILREFDTKWSKEILPQGEYKDHPQYGWRAEFRNRYLHAIHFNSGITCYFATFEQDIHALQGSTVDSIFIDEEIPWSMIPELLLRIQRKNGYFHAVMTPTKGQEEWRCVFEERGTPKERFPEAFKQQISIYDCRITECGSPGLSDEYINKLINRLGTQQEIDLRVYGRFVAQEGLKLPAFNRTINVIKPEKTPEDWLWYSGVDLGGGAGGSLPAIVFVAVKPDFKYGKVVHTWRGDSTKVYTNTDVLDKYIELRQGRSMAGEFYDYASKDFGTMAQRVGVGFQVAEKLHEIGFPLMNALFKNSMLMIEDTADNQELVGEIVNLRHDTNKRRAIDHLTDALRYAVTRVAWNMEGITGERIIKLVKPPPTQDELRRGLYMPIRDESEWSVELEIDEWNDLIESFE